MGMVAQWLERANNIRVVADSLRQLGNLGKFIYPTLPVSFGRDTKRCWSLLSGVYARGSKRSHTVGKCVTYRGLHILPVQYCLHDTDQNSVKVARV